MDMSLDKAEAAMVAKELKQLLLDAVPLSCNLPRATLPNYDNIPGNLMLSSLGLKLGDRVMLDDMKVRDRDTKCDIFPVSCLRKSMGEVGSGWQHSNLLHYYNLFVNLSFDSMFCIAELILVLHFNMLGHTFNGCAGLSSKTFTTCEASGPTSAVPDWLTDRLIFNVNTISHSLLHWEEHVN